ncbi:MAG TPA: protein YgfX [Burkholderiales bacterium]|nr:protein YgfX [Burkholderiales bacterium]
MPVADMLRVEFRPSFLLAGLLGLVHSSALAATWVSLAGWPLYLLFAGILISAVTCVFSALHRSARAAVSLEVHADGRAAWRDRKGDWHQARLGQDHFVSVPLLVIGLSGSELQRKRIVLLPDSASIDDLRRLRVWLRWRGETDSGKAGDTGRV